MKVGQAFNPYRMFVGIFVPNTLVSYKELSSGSKLCYGRLAQYAGENGEAYPAYKSLSEELGVSKRTAMRHVEELTEKEFIAVVHRKDKNNQASNVYKFLWHEIFDQAILGSKDLTSSDRKEVPPRVTDLTPPGDISDTPRVTDLSPKENHLKESLKRSKRSSGHLPPQANELFEKLWRLYPRRRGKGHVSDTQKAELYKVGYDQMKRCIDRFVAEMKAEERQPDKYPYGSTFFNSGYVDYLDENYEEKPKRKKPKEVY